MIYEGLSRYGEIESIKTHGSGETAEVYGSIGENDPIFYKSRILTGIAPLTFKGLGKPLTDYLISGDTVQDGTPTPEAPVDVLGCGVRTGNLFDKDNVLENYYLNNGVPTQYNSGGYVLSDYIPISSNAAIIRARVYKFSYYGAHWAVYDENKTYIRGGIAFDAAGIVNISKIVYTSGAAFIRVDYSTDSFTDCMLNLGSIALPYEPYGYKLPITVNGTEYPIYLGQVPTTRRIKKLVLDGTEQWLANWRTYDGSYASLLISSQSNVRDNMLCTHLLHKSYDQVYYGEEGISTVVSYQSYLLAIRVPDTIASDDSEFKQWLADQYAAGTPVTVWYALAQPETGIVNEPLHKIGDYADTISFAQAGVTIPTASGANVLDMSSTVKPSEVYIRGNIKPTGYGQLVDKDGVNILDKSGNAILVHGQ